MNIWKKFSTKIIPNVYVNKSASAIGVAAIFDDVKFMVEELSKPVSSAEVSDGWTKESKNAIRTYFLGLQSALQSGDALPPLEVVRALDHWGVIDGPLLEKAARISNFLRQR